MNAPFSPGRSLPSQANSRLRAQPATHPAQCELAPPKAYPRPQVDCEEDDIPTRLLRPDESCEAPASLADVRMYRHPTRFIDRHSLVRRKTSRRWSCDFVEPTNAELTDSLLRRHETLIKELRLAEQVQRSMLPRVLPRLDRIEFGAALRPSLHLSGDFYNVQRLDRDHVGFYLGDVMGHGPAAALLGVFAMQGLRTKSIEGTSYEILPPADVLQTLSQDLIRAEFPESPFVTMVYAVLNTQNLSLTYSSGGHPAALLLRPGEDTTRLSSQGPLLGVFESPIEQFEVQLKAGDRVVMYSDGVESVLWGESGLGVDGLVRCLSVRDGRAPQQMVEETMNMAVHSNGPSDDLTLVMLQVD